MTRTGADISHWQASWNANSYYDAEDFLIVKATERESYVDPKFEARWRACGNRPRGAYHFARAGSGDVNAEADHFVRTVKAAGWSGRSTWALDLESNDAGLSAAALTAWADRWCARVRGTLGGRGLFYSYVPFIRSTMGDPGYVPGGCLGWIARYTTAATPYGPPHAKPKGWPDVPDVWQCSNGTAGCVKNVASVGKCDYNRMTDQAFATLFGGQAASGGNWWEGPLSAAELAQIRGAFVEALG